MNTFEICKAICNLSDSVLGAGIIIDNKLVAMDTKPGIPIPDNERLEKMFFQTSLIAGIMIGNSDFFGPARYFTLHFSNADLFFFFLSDYGIKGILAVQVDKEHDHEQIVSGVHGFLARTMKDMKG